MDNYADTILEMRKISKIYDNGVAANRGVDFSLREGEIHALVGENGAGKSTLMKILFGMEKPSSGSIVYRGQELRFESSKDAIAGGIGMVHQHFMLVNSFTVCQNIMLGIEPKKGLFVDSQKARKLTLELSEKYHLEIDPDAVVKNLPVGVKQKIEILKALARGAKILILDEPTAVLTPQETGRLFSELSRLKEQGHTIVFISHKIREVKKISSRITVMREGMNNGVYNTAEVSEQEISNKIVGFEAGMKLERRQTEQGSVRIRVNGLCCYGGGAVPILDNVSFAVHSGRVLGIAGVQGNGQTELVEIMTGSRAPESGSVEINGEDISRLSIRRLRENGCSYIPEDRMRQGAALSASIKENIISNQFQSEAFCEKGILKQKNIANFTGESISRYEIRCNGGGTPLSMLSGGNMQKVVAARECSVEPSALIAEQPTRGVDIRAAHIIHERILSLRDNGCAVLFVSADLGEIFRVCDSLIVMYDGKIAAYFEDAAGISEEELGLCMLGLKKHDDAQIKKAAL
ncbi:MAG: ABC transporter ATP-binding protein [Termitinemataceae bacterium]|nr:MAG: ABC transporter ATP-binding protein [Termitinemataceae bacterium]